MSDLEYDILLNDNNINDITQKDTTPDSLADGLLGLPVSRRLSREMALRAAYVIEMRDCTVEESLKDSLVTDYQIVSDFTARLVALTCTHREQLDEIIRNKIEKWEFHRVAVIDRLILRMAVAEMLYIEEIPPKVSINEAIEIGKKFSTDNSGRFINGVLDSVYGDIGRGENSLLTGGYQDPD